MLNYFTMPLVLFGKWILHDFAPFGGFQERNPAGAHCCRGTSSFAGPEELLHQGTRRNPCPDGWSQGSMDLFTVICYFLTI